MSSLDSKTSTPRKTQGSNRRKKIVKKYDLIVEAGKDDYIWGRIYYGEDLLITVGKSLDELRYNFYEQLHGFYSINLEDAPVAFTIKYDLEGFFEQNPALNISAVGKLAGLNSSLLRQYKTGIKYPSEDQVRKIEQAIHELGEQLLKTKFIVK